MSKTVVVIDKQAVARHMLRFALELQEYRVVEVEDVSGALGALASRNPDLLVIGISPFAADCKDLVGEVRRRPDLDDLPILLVGENRFKDEWDLPMIGNCAWLNKPFRMGELHGLVDSLLSNVSVSGYLAHQRG